MADCRWGLDAGQKVGIYGLPPESSAELAKRSPAPTCATAARWIGTASVIYAASRIVPGGIAAVAAKVAAVRMATALVGSAPAWSE